ncbi:lipid-binding SYLF domain-containing protein [Caldovatus aquaticus]|uniref:Lipid-binding SYLF domain-containing protein n=1 Tax=Caldovatus aquaticus TaxID=2865671 RepID=A0ABS7F2I4_9PROT|nr:lipid-binding SYLF domain-containing protein [Caldovatus aquaticus]MBW8269212.1 lipid-binding SYLF domain-containing protein [Caldovatus aquaticus]
MRRLLTLAGPGTAAILALLLLLLGVPRAARAQAEQQAVVDRATLAVQELMLGDGASEAARLLRRARAVMVCPRVFRAGFLFGGEGGDCVLLARDGAGSWSSPAFYGIASVSAGLQIGVQDLQIMMIILTDRGLNALLDSQFKIGADASVAFAHLGVGVEGALTTAIGADIVAFARARGLYAGLTLEGSILSQRSAWNRAYYGREVSPRQIVIEMAVHNPGSDPLRGVLLRFSSGGAALPATPPPGPPAYAPPGAGLPAAAGPALPGAVQREALPPPPAAPR